MKSAVDQIVGDIFAETKRSGSAGPNLRRAGGRSGSGRGRLPTPSVNRMAHVGAKDGAAVFKLVRSGGTAGKAALGGQMRYIFNDKKLAGVIDPANRLQMQNRVEPKAMNAIIDDWSQSWWAGTRNGNTSHMILSYPASASIEQVQQTTRDVLEELLSDGGRQFDYVAAIHDDKEHHPHVHVIVNRRADDNKLFNLRAGTELSYERFRQSMTDHGLKYGLELDPTFRFERGITARQPELSEQRAAMREGRKPQDRPRLGADLIYQKDLIDHARIGYEALAVIAYNADCERLFRAYHEASRILDREGVIPKMDLELDGDELARFEQTKQVFEEALSLAQERVAAQEPADRVAAEMQLDELMRDLTSISRDAPYAEALHRPAESNSIYMHEMGERPQALHEPVATDVFKRIEADYGISAEGLEARLEAGRPSEHLEQQWIRDDLQAIADRDGLSLDTREGEAKALDTLEQVYDRARTTLVAERAIDYLPHMDREAEIPFPEREHYTFMQDRDAADLDEVMTYYRENGAPEVWLTENKPVIENALNEVNKEREALFAAIAPDGAKDFEAELRRFDGPQIEVTEEDRQRAEQYLEPGLFDGSEQETLQRLGSNIARAEPLMPHHMIDDLAESRLRELDLTLDLDRALAAEVEPGMPDGLKQYAERSAGQRYVTHSDEDRAELVRIVRADANSEELEALRRADISALDRLSGHNELFARQLVEAFDNEFAQHNRYNYTPEMEENHTENFQELSKHFAHEVELENRLEL